MNIKLINKNNLLYNLNLCEKSRKIICPMVKANAYGHGIKEIVGILKEKVNWFGVANANEALKVKKISKNSKLLVVGKTCEYSKLIKNNISFTIDSFEDIKKINLICNKINKKAYVHIAINTGMNRIGVKNLYEFQKILNIINCNENIILEGIFTHFFDADCEKTNFYNQLNIFSQYVKLVNKKVLVHIGGSFVLNYKLPDYIDMVRVGFFIYGYGKNDLKPVMSIYSEILKIKDCKKGEYVGYGNTNQLKKDSKIATISLGYADGLSRRLSNKLKLTINGKKAKIFGNVCMDMCMVDVTNVPCKIKDFVLVVSNIQTLAKLIGTSPYECLTNFQSFRGKSLIV